MAVLGVPATGKDKGPPRTDYYPSVMSAIQRLTHPGSAEDRLKFYVRLRTASHLQFANEAPDPDAATRSMEDLESAINKVELELAKSRSAPPPVDAPAATRLERPALADDEPPPRRLMPPAPSVAPEPEIAPSRSQRSRQQSRLEPTAPRPEPEPEPEPEDEAEVFEDVIGDPNPGENGVPPRAHLFVAALVLVLAAIGSGAAVWFLAAPQGPTASQTTPFATAAVPPTPAVTLPANVPVRNLRRVSPEALVGIRLLMPAELAAQPWAYDLSGTGSVLSAATIAGKPAVAGWVCKPDACGVSIMTFAVALDGTNAALAVLAPQLNNGRAAFIGAQGSEAVAIATKLLTEARPAPA
ncbi:MAG: hypothetical protein ABIO40_04380 [Devosia sp.]